MVAHVAAIDFEVPLARPLMTAADAAGQWAQLMAADDGDPAANQENSGSQLPPPKEARESRLQGSLKKRTQEPLQA